MLCVGYTLTITTHPHPSYAMLTCDGLTASLCLSERSGPRLGELLSSLPSRRTLVCSQGLLSVEEI